MTTKGALKGINAFLTVICMILTALVLKAGFSWLNLLFICGAWICIIGMWFEVGRFCGCDKAVDLLEEWINEQQNGEDN